MAKSSNGFVDAVREFHEKCGYTCNDAPSLEDTKRRELWVRLIEEEVSELKKAVEEVNMVGVADAVADIIYVTVGAGLAFGFPVAELFEEVHQSNLTKLKGRRKARPDGKVLKGSNYRKPRIERVLKRASKTGRGTKP